MCKKNFILFLILSFVLSCKESKPLSAAYLKNSSVRMMVFNQEIIFSGETIIDKEVTIYPEAFLRTNPGARLIFTKKVNILGESQVFDENIDLTFQPGTLSVINPSWFGAKGYDEVDDTKAFQKVIEIARTYANTINIEIPIGNFIITKTLEIGNEDSNGKSINLIGSGMSGNSGLGSCLLWRGLESVSLLLWRNNSNCTISNLDFNAEQGHTLKNNLELRPTVNQLEIKNCSFAGCAGIESSNINLNTGSDLQVSEVAIENCIFRSVTYDNKKWLTQSAVVGGLANTKNFYFKNCSFIGYTIGAINIGITDILKVENCTFALNEVDISCNLCNTLASSNYSEYSKSFFKSGVSQNVSFTTLSDNCFYGSPDADFVIKEGAGSLVLLNNNLGGMGGNDQTNKIKWADSVISSIYSIGNYFRNDPKELNPFYNMRGEKQINQILSIGDKSGTNEQNIRKISPNN